MHSVVLAASLFSGRDAGCRRYITVMETVGISGTSGTSGTEFNSVPTPGKAGKAGNTPVKNAREKIFDAVVEGDRDSIVRLVHEGMEDGLDPSGIFLDILT